jgi:hypothetical protein
MNNKNIEPSTKRSLLSKFDIGILALILLSIISVTTPVIEYNKGFDSDGVFYGAMAGEEQIHPRLKFVAPFCWRVVTPFLASILPFSTITNFTVLAFLSNWLSLIMLYTLLRQLGFNKKLSVIGMFFYTGIFWTAKFSFYSPAYIDYQTQLFILLILLLMEWEKYWWIVPIMCIGVLQKESILIYGVVPYSHFASRKGWISWTSISYLVALLVVPFLTIITAHALITPINNYSPLVVFHYLKGLLNPGFWPRFLLAIFSGLGLLPLIILFRLKVSVEFLSRNFHWLIVIIAGTALLFGGSDKARLFLYMLPAIIVCALSVIKNTCEQTTGSKVFAWIMVTLLLHFYVGNFLTPMGTVADYLSRMVPVHAPGASYLPSLASKVIVSLIWFGLTHILLHSRRTLADRSV